MEGKEEGKREGEEEEEHGSKEEEEAEKEDSEEEEKGFESGVVDPQKNWEKKKEAKMGLSKEEEEEAEKMGNQPRVVEGEKKNEMRILIPYWLVAEYKEVLRQVKYGSIETETTFSTTGRTPNLQRLVEFIYTQGRKPKGIFEKRKYLTSQEGSEVFQRPITIYIGIDTSGSMSGKREEVSLKHALALLAAYNELKREIKDFGDSGREINMKLFSIATENGVLVIEYDASEFSFRKAGDSVMVEFDFIPIGGGTDLVGMIETFEKRIEEIEEKNARALLRGEIAVNPSILILYFTDFGDNAGDAVGVAKAIEGFGKFAEKYRDDSRVIGGGINDAGVAVVFVAPEVDDKYVFKEAEKVLDKGVVKSGTKLTIESAERIAEALKSQLPVLHGYKASNVLVKEE